MSESSQEREARIAKFYHGEVGLKNADGIDVGPKGDKIVAGEDDRKDYFNLEIGAPGDNLKRKLADATAILTDKSDLIGQADGSFKLNVGKFLRRGLAPCSGERFGNQHVGGWCSGFMVGTDVIVTAGHCGETEAEIQNTAYVFGFHVTSSDDPGTTQFLADQVYFGKELIAHELSPTGDFAIVRVDREITASGAAPLQVRKSGAIGLGQNIGVIGYPSGLPVKIAFGDATVVMRDEDPWLFANLDTYGGNSGSAVFNADGLVEGILVRGAKDYDLDLANDCFRSNQIEDADGSEAVTKANVFVEKLPNNDV
jgi:V8-like Glu-specific endopeptidase